jgi:hypothetical protein
MDDATFHRARALHRDFHALQAVQVVRWRSQRLGSERNIAEAGTRGVATGQLHGPNCSLVVEHHKGRQNVVHLIERHVETENGVAIHFGFILEVADARGGQHHAPECQISSDSRRDAE